MKKVQPLLAPLLLVALCACQDENGAKVQLAQEQVRKLNKAADFFFIEKKKCPQSANEVAHLFTGKEDNVVNFNKDPWGNDYVLYEVEKGCHFKSLGADSQPGGEGSNADIL